MGKKTKIIHIDQMLCAELDKIVKAGDKLAEAAHFVQSNYDGIHRTSVWVVFARLKIDEYEEM